MCAALLAWAAAAVYTLRFNPEIKVYRTAFETKEQWAKKLNEQFPQKFVIAGGSSCATSIMGRRLLEQHGLPVLNFGFHAGMGAEVITRGALAQTRPGDTLVLAMEPDLLEMPATIPSLGKQFAIAVGHPEFLGPSPVSARVSAAFALRPGGYHFFTLLGKVALHQPLYRYAAEDFDASGYQRVDVRRDFAPPVERPRTVSPPARELLRWLRDECAARKVRVAYAPPWVYSSTENAAAARKSNHDLLLQVAEFLPVLADEKLGVYPVREQFADTEAHLTPEGAALRTDDLATRLKTWRTWSTNDLLSIADR